MLRSVTTVQRVSSPNDSNSDLSQSSSTFHDSEPTNKLLLFSPAPLASFLAFFGAGDAGTSALRFLSSLGFSASDSESDVSESDSESEDSESEDCEETLAGEHAREDSANDRQERIRTSALRFLISLGFSASDSESEVSESDSESEDSESEDCGEKSAGERGFCQRQARKKTHISLGLSGAVGHLLDGRLLGLGL